MTVPTTIHDLPDGISRACNLHIAALTPALASFGARVLAFQMDDVITQVLVELTNPDTADEHYIIVWSDGPHGGFEPFKTRREASQYFMEQWTQREEEDA